MSGDARHEEVPFEQFNACIREEERPDDEAHFEDTRLEDEVEIQYG